jgi:hypothetical protein
MDEIEEEQKRDIEKIYIKMEDFSKLLENREEYLDELSQFLKRGEKEKGKQKEILEISDSTQLRIKPPTNFF